MQPVTTFVSAINGAKFDIQNPLIATLLSRSEKKEIIHIHQASKPARKNGGKSQNSDSSDNEQVIG